MTMRTFNMLIISPNVIQRSMLLLLSCCLLGGCNKPPDSKTPETTTEQVKRESILKFNDIPPPWRSTVPVYSNGEEAGELSILESLGGGVGLIDYDQDGRIDLLFPGGGTLTNKQAKGLPNHLWKCFGDDFDEVANFAGIEFSKHYTHGVSIADYNNDGFPDALITGYSGVALWENLGDGTFENVTEAVQLSDAAWSSSAGWGDLNGDGDLDLYVTHYVNWSFENNPPCNGPAGQPDVCPPRQFEGLDDTLYLSNGDGTFSDGTISSGLQSAGKGLGVLLSDFDNDADLDIYVANDTTPNFLYLNNGQGQLSEEGIISGTALDDRANATGSMGLAVNDFNNDSISDIWVTNYEDEVSALYQGGEGAAFQHVSSRTGIQSLGELFVGFGCIATDLDLDGDEDIAVANGHVVHFPRNASLLQEPLILENEESTRFMKFVPEPGSFLNTPALGRGLVQHDFNDDGLPDLLFANSGEMPTLVMNETPATGKAVRFQLVGTQSNRNAIGTRIRLYDAEGKTQLTRWIYGGGSYLSSGSPIVHFGIPKDVWIMAVEVTWPSGEITTYRPCCFECEFLEGQVHVIVEPDHGEYDPNTTDPIHLGLPKQETKFSSK